MVACGKKSEEILLQKNQEIDSLRTQLAEMTEKVDFAELNCAHRLESAVGREQEVQAQEMMPLQLSSKERDEMEIDVLGNYIAGRNSNSMDAEAVQLYGASGAVQDVSQNDKDWALKQTSLAIYGEEAREEDRALMEARDDPDAATSDLRHISRIRAMPPWKVIFQNTKDQYFGLEQGAAGVKGRHHLNVIQFGWQKDKENFLVSFLEDMRLISTFASQPVVFKGWATALVCTGMVLSSLFLTYHMFHLLVIEILPALFAIGHLIYGVHIGTSTSSALLTALGQTELVRHTQQFAMAIFGALALEDVVENGSTVWRYLAWKPSKRSEKLKEFVTKGGKRKDTERDVQLGRTTTNGIIGWAKRYFKMPAFMAQVWDTGANQVKRMTKYMRHIHNKYNPVKKLYRQVSTAAAVFGVEYEEEERERLKNIGTRFWKKRHRFGAYVTENVIEAAATKLVMIYYLVATQDIYVQSLAEKVIQPELLRRYKKDSNAVIREKRLPKLTRGEKTLFLMRYLSRGSDAEYQFLLACNHLVHMFPLQKDVYEYKMQPSWHMFVRSAWKKLKSGFNQLYERFEDLQNQVIRAVPILTRLVTDMLQSVFDITEQEFGVFKRDTFFAVTDDFDPATSGREKKRDKANVLAHEVDNARIGRFFASLELKVSSVARILRQEERFQKFYNATSATSSDAEVAQRATDSAMKAEVEESEKRYTSNSLLGRYRKWKNKKKPAPERRLKHGITQRDVPAMISAAASSSSFAEIKDESEESTMLLNKLTVEEEQQYHNKMAKNIERILDKATTKRTSTRSTTSFGGRTEQQQRQQQDEDPQHLEPQPFRTARQSFSFVEKLERNRLKHTWRKKVKRVLEKKHARERLKLNNIKPISSVGSSSSFVEQQLRTKEEKLDTGTKKTSTMKRLNKKWWPFQKKTVDKLAEEICPHNDYCTKQCRIIWKVKPRRGGVNEDSLSKKNPCDTVFNEVKSRITSSDWLDPQQGQYRLLPPEEEEKAKHGLKTSNKRLQESTAERKLLHVLHHRRDGEYTHAQSQEEMDVRKQTDIHMVLRFEEEAAGVVEGRKEEKDTIKAEQEDQHDPTREPRCIVSGCATNEGSDMEQVEGFTDWVSQNPFSNLGKKLFDTAYTKKESKMYCSMYDLICGHEDGCLFETDDLIVDHAKTEVAGVCAGSWLVDKKPPVCGTMVTVADKKPNVGKVTHYWRGSEKESLNVIKAFYGYSSKLQRLRDFVDLPMEYFQYIGVDSVTQTEVAGLARRARSERRHESDQQANEDVGNVVVNQETVRGEKMSPLVAGTTPATTSSSKELTRVDHHDDDDCVPGRDADCPDKDEEVEEPSLLSTAFQPRGTESADGGMMRVNKNEMYLPRLVCEQEFASPLLSDEVEPGVEAPVDYGDWLEMYLLRLPNPEHIADSMLEGAKTYQVREEVRKKISKWKRSKSNRERAASGGAVAVGELNSDEDFEEPLNVPEEGSAELGWYLYRVAKRCAKHWNAYLESRQKLVLYSKKGFEISQLMREYDRLLAQEKRPWSWLNNGLGNNNSTTSSSAAAPEGEKHLLEKKIQLMEAEVNEFEKRRRRAEDAKLAKWMMDVFLHDETRQKKLNDASGRGAHVRQFEAEKEHMKELEKEQYYMSEHAEETNSERLKRWAEERINYEQATFVSAQQAIHFLAMEIEDATTQLHSQGGFDQEGGDNRHNNL
ncbi:unnamed protein product [Amoebophrya sp. A120]|nr:unnamed protein product [Amoebophrya sp. A120]|eukprot:GSA120T00019909001.1